MTENSVQSGNNQLPTKFYQSAIRYIEPGASVLNLGCGGTFNFERLLWSEKQSRCTSVDFNQPGIIPDSATFIRASVAEPLAIGEFDVVTFFEVIEHIDHTDVLLRNCFENLKPGGRLIFSFPNLASIYGRIELLLGYQPHILEVSNEGGAFGSGIFGKMNGNDPYHTIHHIRGITHRAMKELVVRHRFEIEKIIGESLNRIRVFNIWPPISPVNLFVCRKPAG